MLKKVGLLSRCNEELRLFLLEIFLSVAAPFSLLLVRRIRDSAQGLYLAAVLTLLGFAIFGLVARYLPIFPQREGAYARRFALFTDASSSRAKLVGRVVEPRCRVGTEGCGLGSESATFNIGHVIGYRI
jgi:hypothetical protein